jgi:SagB-type dehydrogenase family enzyme
MMTRSLFVRNPALLGYGAEIDGQASLALEIESGRPPLLIDDPRLFWAVGALPSEFDECEAKKLWAAEPDCKLVTDALWEFCRAERLVLEADTARRQPDAPYAGYHAATRSYPFLDMSTTAAFVADNALMQQYAQAEPAPPIYDSHPSSWRQQLRKVEEFDSFEVTSELDQLSIMFDGTFGERFRRDLEFDEEVGYLQVELTFKSIPSGGSRHPTEAFAHIDSSALPRGLYHYNVEQNSLDLLDTQLRVEDLSSLIGNDTGEIPDLVWFLCSRVERAMWRYRDPRSFRAIVVDAGHAHHQLSELARLYGYEIGLVRSPDRDAAARCLGVDPTAFPVIALGWGVKA